MDNKILDMYMRQVHLDNDTDNTNVSINEKIDGDIAAAMREMRSSELDMANSYRKNYPNADFSTIKSEIQPITVCVKRIYCPNCGKEIVTTAPERKNPVSGEVIQRFDCKCGYKCNLDSKYPKLVYIDENNNEINF
jgi:RNase P subunit RPR2